jgi:two-component system, NtrC family, sensor kinase
MPFLGGLGGGMVRRTRISVKPARGRKSKGTKQRRRTKSSARGSRQRTEASEQLSRELQEARGQLAATSKILGTISSSAFDLNAVFKTVAESSGRLCGADRANIFRFDGEVLRIAAAFNAPKRLMDWLEQNPIKPGQHSVVARTALERRTTHVLDVLTDPKHTYAAKAIESFRTCLGVPILKGDHLLGVVLVYHLQIQPFTPTQISLVETFAKQAAVAIENARLLNQLRESLQQQTATSDVLMVISRSTFDLQMVLDTLVKSAVQLCEAERGLVFRREGDTYKSVAYYNYAPEFKAFHESHPIIPDRGTAVGRAALEGKTVQIVDILADPEYTFSEAQKLGGGRATLAVPLLRERTSIGALALQRTEPRPYTREKIELVETFANQAVIAIENARLLNELRESLRQQTATADVLKVISRSTFDLQTVLDTLTESATRLCAVDQGVIFLRDGDVLRLRASFGFPQEAVEYALAHPMLPNRGSAIGRVALEGKPVHIHDVLADPEYSISDYQRMFGYRTVLSVPLLRESATIGVFALTRSVVEPFSDKQIELVSTFADQAVIAIENARLLKELSQRTTDLSEALEQQTATSEILNTISTSLSDVSPIFNAILENAIRLCNGDVVVLWQFDGQVLRFAAGKNASSEAHLRAHPVELGTYNPTALAGLEQRIVHELDVFANPAYRPLVQATSTQPPRSSTVLAVPLVREEKLLGVITIWRFDKRLFSDKQIELVQNFAAQAVIAIENARLLAELRQSLQRQTATADVLKIISRSTFDLQTVFQTLIESAAQLCGAHRANISRIRDGRFQHVAVYGFEEGYLEYMQAHPVLLDRGSINGRTALDRAIVHVHDVLVDPEYRLHDAQKVGSFRTALGLPLMREGVPIGTMFLGRSSVQPFTEQEIELVASFADQAVIAIENTRLLNELRESLQQQTATADVLKVISRSTFDLQIVLDTLTASVARLCEAEMAAIVREKGAAHYWATSYGFPPELSEYLKSIPIEQGRGSVVGRVLMEGKTVHVPDVLADPDYTFSGAQKRGGYRTMLSVPLLREGTPLGVVLLMRRTVQPFTDKQIELVSTFADQAVIAIENVRLFESVETRTRELSKSLEDLRTAQDRLVQTEKLASLGQLTAGIAHEIKNPLNFVNNFSAVSAELVEELQEALAGANLDPKLRGQIEELSELLQNNLEKVVQHGKRADAIVRNMLLHSRAGSGERRPVDINAVVEESLNLAYHGARAENQSFNITIERSFDPAAGDVDLYPQEITRVLLNLIANGFYAATKRKTDANGSDYEPVLNAATKNLGEEVEIRIRDNGTGISPDVQEKMFNPFFTTKPAGEGTGLGLSISHDIIVKQHGGSIEVDTRPGEFTEFRIILPRAAALLPERS